MNKTLRYLLVFLIGLLILSWLLFIPIKNYAVTQLAHRGVSELTATLGSLSLSSVTVENLGFTFHNEQQHATVELASTTLPITFGTLPRHLDIDHLKIEYKMLTGGAKPESKDSKDSSAPVIPLESFFIRQADINFTLPAEVIDYPHTVQAALRGPIELKNNIISSRGSLSIQNKPYGDYQLTLDIREKTADLKLQSMSKANFALLQPLLKDQASAVSIEQGLIDLDLQLSMNSNNEPNGKLTIQVKNTSGHYEKIQFNHIASTIYVNELPPEKADIDIELGQVRFANGLAANGNRFNLAWTTEKVMLKRALMQVLESRFSVRQANINYLKNQHNANVVAESIDLKSLLDWFKQPGLSGSGRLEGILPVNFDNGVLTINQAKLENKGPGIIRYMPPGTAGNKNLAFTALKNFHYNHLKAVINYDARGKYEIKLRLEGKNPDLYSGHPVNFNLTIDGELPGLLRTHLVTGEFDQAILDEINKTR